MCAGAGRRSRFRRKLSESAGVCLCRLFRQAIAGVGSGGKFRKVPVGAGVGSRGKFWKVPEGSGVCWCRCNRIPEGSGGFQCVC